jgi:fructoselysine-6-P-deglycase FrlB-like protein
MHAGLWPTGLWQDVARMPRELAATLDAAEGFDETVALLTRPGTRRIVVTGNGASYYVGMALWLAALAGERMPVEVVAIPGGLVAQGRFRWREGDVLLAISSSGEFRDVIEAIEDDDMPGPFATVTATPDATVGRAASAVAVVTNPDQLAITHTQAFCGGVLACLALWARISDDAGLEAELRNAPEACASAIDRATAWAEETFDEVDTPTASIAFGTENAWAAALENALLIKEVARIPCEGVETREGATAAMTALLPQHLAVSFPTGQDPLCVEAEELCRSLGAPVLRAPGGDEADRRLAAVTTFPSAVALCAELALRQGRSVDEPEWYGQYTATARRA